MFTATLFLSVLLAVISGGTCANNCGDDCVPFNRCPEALTMVHKRGNKETKQLIRRAYCGMENRYTKICCSLFKPEEPVSFPKRIDADIKPVPVSTDHPNLHLLNTTCGDIYESRITMGRIANMYEYPWMALIGYNTDRGPEFDCSGSVINYRYILTAAHCVVGKNVAGVRIGEYDMRYDEDCDGNVCENYIQDIPVEDIIYHKDYKGHPSYSDDIALIRLQQDINFDCRNAQPICLPVTKELREGSITNKMATVAGWGLTEHKSESSILLKVIIPVNSLDICEGYYSQFFNENSTRFCAGNAQKDSCRGDSGGPLILEDWYKGFVKFVQFGIVSNGGYQCGQSPGIYTDVRKYMDWILDNIKK